MVDFFVEKYFVDEKGSLMDAMNAITRNHQGIGFICEGRKLRAAISDGDIRRWLISSGQLLDKAELAANFNPKYVLLGEERIGEQLLEKYDCGAIPVIDLNGNVTGIIVRESVEHEQLEKISVPVVIMAGGKGERLQPYTEVLPKPLIPIGEKTILERIIDKFASQGCDDFSIIVNYKKNLIRSYLEEINADYRWELYEESQFLGTAGGLKLVSDRINGTFIVSNCDVLVDCDYSDCLKYHYENENYISVISVKKNYRIPYGMLDLDDHSSLITNIKEKPVIDIIVNTGVYIVEAKVLDMIPDNTFIHMTDILSECISKEKRIGAYIIDEDNWLDMGQYDAMLQMKKAFL